MKTVRLVDTITDRVNELNTTLIWTDDRDLLSSTSGRILAKVTQDNDTGHFVAFIGNSYCENGTRFVDENKAKEWVKFTVLKDILSEEMRQYRIQ